MTEATLNGKAIIVTGAAQGIGKGIVELALERGACVAAVDVNADGSTAATRSGSSLRQGGAPRWIFD